MLYSRTLQEHSQSLEIFVQEQQFAHAALSAQVLAFNYLEW